MYNRGRDEDSDVFYNTYMQDIEVPGGPYGSWLELAGKDSAKAFP